MDPRQEIRRLRRETSALALKRPSTAARRRRDVDLIEFAVSPAFLDASPFPRQATLLKMWHTATDDLWTQFDHDVIGEWTQRFADTGNNGVQPDYWQRRRLCREAGRPWFREFLFVGGRRGGKGFVGSILGAFVTYQHTHVIEREAAFGIDPDKEMVGLVVGPNLPHAKHNLYGDLAARIRGAPCFRDVITRQLDESITLEGPTVRLRSGREVRTSYRVAAAGTTLTAGRGPASYMLLFDEMAWMIPTSGGALSAEAVYRGSIPSLDQVGKYGCIFVGSSPWQKTGEFYSLYERSLEVDGNGLPAYPEILMTQLTSWDPYEDHGRTDPSLGSRRLRLYPEQNVTAARHFFLAPSGEKFEYLPHRRRAIQRYDDDMRQLERANPEAFRVERLAHFATVQDAYLPEHLVVRLFAPHNGTRLPMQTHGQLGTRYVAHADPSKSGANFGFAIAHTERDPNTGWKHVVVDVINAWKPEDFPDNDYEIDYEQIEQELASYMDRFMPAEFTFDQYNSVHPIQALRRHALARRYPKDVAIFERNFTRDENYKIAENFKTALGLDLIHAPYFELAELELKFLQDRGNRRIDPPTAGHVTTKDTADCLMILTWVLIADQIEEISAALGDTPLGAAAPSGANALMSPQDQLSASARPASPYRRSSDGGRLFDPLAQRRRRHRGAPGQRFRN